MSPVRDDRVAVEKWPTPYTRRGHAQPPKIRPVSLAAPAAAWTAQAACAGDWDLFDAPEHGLTSRQRAEQLALARAICQSCPVQRECDTYATTATPRVSGIWAGRRRHPSSSKDRSTTA